MQILENVLVFIPGSKSSSKDSGDKKNSKEGEAKVKVENGVKESEGKSHSAEHKAKKEEKSSKSSKKESRWVWCNYHLALSLVLMRMCFVSSESKTKRKERESHVKEEPPAKMSKEDGSTSRGSSKEKKVKQEVRVKEEGKEWEKEASHRRSTEPSPRHSDDRGTHHLCLVPLSFLLFTLCIFLFSRFQTPQARNVLA